MNGYMGLEAAISVASSAHLGQRDKGGLPYILHPLAVMLSMPQDDEAGRIVAVLHDVVEDTVVNLDRLRLFGFATDVVDAVDAISKRDGETNRDYWTRCKANPIAARVKIKDMEHNSSEERLACLGADEAEYLRGKYAEARALFAEQLQ